MSEEEIEKIEPVKDNKLFFLKLLTGIIFLGAFITVISIKLTTDKPIVLPLIILGVTTIFFIISVFGKNLAEKFTKDKHEEKTPEPVGEERIMEILQETVEKRMDNIRKQPPVTIKPFTINKNLIYLCEVHLCLDNEKIYIIINATYPERIPATLPGETSLPTLRQAVNAISTNPKEDPDKEERTETDLSTGKQIRFKKTTHKEKKKKEDEESVI